MLPSAPLRTVEGKLEWLVCPSVDTNNDHITGRPPPCSVVAVPNEHRNTVATTKPISFPIFRWST
jgi:hypothetical protein